jgi:hypothetical protein
MGADAAVERAEEGNRKGTLDEGDKGAGGAAHACHDEENADARGAVARISGVDWVLSHGASCKPVAQEIGTKNARH